MDRSRSSVFHWMRKPDLQAGAPARQLRPDVLRRRLVAPVLQVPDDGPRAGAPDRRRAHEARGPEGYARVAHRRGARHLLRVRPGGGGVPDRTGVPERRAAEEGVSGATMTRR